jgi:hypothetical protein
MCVNLERKVAKASDIQIFKAREFRDLEAAERKAREQVTSDVRGQVSTQLIFGRTRRDGLYGVNNNNNNKYPKKKMR